MDNKLVWGVSVTHLAGRPGTNIVANDALSQLSYSPLPVV